MSVKTVNGNIDKSSLGIVSSHEHILIDISNQQKYYDEISLREVAKQKVSIENLGLLYRNPYAITENLKLNETIIAKKEILEFKKAGGKTIVDVTLPGIGRDPLFLKSLSNELGINIITATGLYTQDTHPEWAFEATIEDLAELFIKEIRDGIGYTGIKAGVIGEIGTSMKVLDNEKKVLIASARAYLETGTSVMVHCYPWATEGLCVLDILEETGVPSEKICICHTDVEFNIEYIQRLLDRGAYVEFDNFGKEYYINKSARGFAGGIFARDIERVRVAKKLIEQGYVQQLLFSCDICLKTLLHTYGGWGYDHVLTNIMPMMLDEGVAQEDVDTIILNNPAKFLDIR